MQCYCPKVGSQCESLLYTVNLNGLVNKTRHIGNHNRNYYFTIKVTNKAKLVNIEHMDVLVDDSPPEPGVVLEGEISCFLSFFSMYSPSFYSEAP